MIWRGFYVSNIGLIQSRIDSKLHWWQFAMYARVNKIPNQITFDGLLKFVYGIVIRNILHLETWKNRRNECLIFLPLEDY